MAAIQDLKMGELDFGFVEEERDIQKNYWVEHSVDLTIESMMLDTKASDLDKEERPEFLKGSSLQLVLSWSHQVLLELVWNQETQECLSCTHNTLLSRAVTINYVCSFSSRFLPLKNFC